MPCESLQPSGEGPSDTAPRLKTYSLVAACFSTASAEKQSGCAGRGVSTMSSSATPADESSDVAARDRATCDTAKLQAMNAAATPSEAAARNLGGQRRANTTASAATTNST